MDKSIGVICVDDHPLIVAGVEAIVDTEQDMEFIGGAMTAADGLELFRKSLPDVALIDLRLPDMAGARLISTILREFPRARTIALTTYKGDADIREALSAGALGYLLKDLMHDDLVAAIRKVHGGARYIAPAAATSLAEHVPQAGLSTRELEVLRLMADGNRNKEIAGALRVSEDTIKFHIKSILSKLGVHDRTHAVTLAIKRGMLHLD